MNPPRFPQRLHTGPFTYSEGLSSGLTPGRLRHRELLILSRGIRQIKNDADTPLALLARPFTLVNGYSAASHATAFELWDFPGFLPQDEQPTIHISRQYPHTSLRREGITSHRTMLSPEEIIFHQGLWITSRKRTWLDCARRMSIDELVVVADHLIRSPRPDFENRFNPYCTIAELKDLLQKHKGTPGIRKAREALLLARIGSDSAPETRLRLAVSRAGLPEPQLNVPVKLSAGVVRVPDESFSEYKVAVEYEGNFHSLDERVQRDVAREEDFVAAGWKQVRITRRHMPNGAHAAVAKIRTALIENGWQPPTCHL